MRDNLNVEAPPSVPDKMPKPKDSRKVPRWNVPAQKPATVRFRKRHPIKGNVLQSILVPLKPKTSHDFLGSFGASGNVHCPCCHFNGPGLTVLDKEVSWDDDISVYKIM
jgi:hypothetical protein